MPQCSKSTIYLIALLSSLFILLILLNYQKEPEDAFLTLVLEENESERNIETTQTDRIINLTVTYKLQPKPCENKSEIIILVTSYYGNVETRSSIRKAFREFALDELGIKRVFLLGIAPNDKYTKQNAIENESARFKDLLQGEFVESYKNLTYKHLMGLKWAVNECPQTKCIVKMDDDIVLNLRSVIEYLRNIKLPKILLAGYVLKNMPIIREPQNKWYVSQKELKGKYYPNFVSGWFYITNHYTADFLVRTANMMQYFWIDDAFITGIVALRLKIRHYDLSDHFITDPQHTICCYRDAVESNVDCEFFAAPNGGDNNLFYKMNFVLQKCQNGSCKKRTKFLNETCKMNLNQVNFINGKPLIEDFKLV